MDLHFSPLPMCVHGNKYVVSLELNYKTEHVYTEYMYIFFNFMLSCSIPM